jgi:hypothetical protein
METMKLEGETAHNGGDVCVDVCFASKKSSGNEFLFLPECT